MKKKNQKSLIQKLNKRKMFSIKGGTSNGIDTLKTPTDTIANAPSDTTSTPNDTAIVG